MKNPVKKWIWSAAGVIIGAGLFFHVPIVKADPHPWSYGWLANHDHEDEDDNDQGEHHHRHYRYYYYPAQQVYYSPVKRVYYYQNAGNWIYAPVLPPTIQLGRRVNINLGTPVPYVEHAYVTQQYPVVIVPR